jgi:hypothetical protein
MSKIVSDEPKISTQDKIDQTENNLL